MFAYLRAVLVHEKNKLTNTVIELGDGFEMTLVQTHFDWVERTAEKLDLSLLRFLFVMGNRLAYQGAKFFDKLGLVLLSLCPDSL